VRGLRRDVDQGSRQRERTRCPRTAGRIYQAEQLAPSDRHRVADLGDGPSVLFGQHLRSQLGKRLQRAQARRQTAPARSSGRGQLAGGWAVQRSTTGGSFQLEKAWTRAACAQPNSRSASPVLRVEQVVCGPRNSEASVGSNLPRGAHSRGPRPAARSSRCPIWRPRLVRRQQCCPRWSRAGRGPRFRHVDGGGLRGWVGERERPARRRWAA